MTPRTLVRPSPSLAAPTLCFTLRVTNFNPPFRLRLALTALTKQCRRPESCRPLLPTLNPLTQHTTLRLKWPPLHLIPGTEERVLATCRWTCLACDRLKGLTSPTSLVTPRTPLENPVRSVPFLRPWNLTSPPTVLLTADWVTPYLLLLSLLILVCDTILGTWSRAVN